MSHGGHAASDRATGEAVGETSLPDQSSALCQTHKEREKGVYACTCIYMYMYMYVNVRIFCSEHVLYVICTLVEVYMYNVYTYVHVHVQTYYV